MIPPYSRSLFKDVLMCKPDKPALSIVEDAFIVDAVTRGMFVATTTLQPLCLMDTTTEHQ